MANPRPTPKPGNLGPQTSLTRCTFPVLYPVLAPERGPEWQNPRPTPKPGPGSKVTGVIPSEIQPEQFGVGSDPNNSVSVLFSLKTELTPIIVTPIIARKLIIT